MIDYTMLYLVVIVGLFAGDPVSSDGPPICIGSDCCPPTSGIYLMHGETCYPDGSYFSYDSLTKMPLVCGIVNEQIVGGEWVKPDGEPFNCSTEAPQESLHCLASVELPHILLRGTGPEFNETYPNQVYKCCLPYDCSDPRTNIITAHIFAHVQISYSNYEITSSLLEFPQEYILHCTTTGYNIDLLATTTSSDKLAWYTYKDYETTRTRTVLTSVSCSDNECVQNYTLLYSSNQTYDNTLRVSLSEQEIQANTLTYEYKCLVRVSGITREALYKIRAPKVILSIEVIRVTAHTVTIAWESVGSLVADGYVVNVTAINGSNTTTEEMVHFIEGCNEDTTIIYGLARETIYDITIRAYQDILGPASEPVRIETLSSAISLVNWTQVSPMTNLQYTEYRIDCITVDFDPTESVIFFINGRPVNGLSSYSNDNGMTFINTIFITPDPLGVSTNVTCSVEYQYAFGESDWRIRRSSYIIYNDSKSVILKAPSIPPLNLNGKIYNLTSLILNWSMPSSSEQSLQGYIVKMLGFKNNAGSNVYTIEPHSPILYGVNISTYIISMYSYIDLPSVESSQIVFKFDAPSPVMNLAASQTSATSATITWFGPSTREGNYVSYFNISYIRLSCNLESPSSLHNKTMTVFPYYSPASFNYTLTGLHSGAEYIIKVTAGNIIGESCPMDVVIETSPAIPTGSPRSVTIQQINETVLLVAWDDIYCSEKGGIITSYSVKLIDPDNVIYQAKTHYKYYIYRDIKSIGTYSASVAAYTAAGIGPYSNIVSCQIATSEVSHTISPWLIILIVLAVGFCILLILSVFANCVFIIRIILLERVAKKANRAYVNLKLQEIAEKD